MGERIRAFIGILPAFLIVGAAQALELDFSGPQCGGSAATTVWSAIITSPDGTPVVRHDNFSESSKVVTLADEGVFSGLTISRGLGAPCSLSGLNSEKVQISFTCDNGVVACSIAPVASGDSTAP